MSSASRDSRAAPAGSSHKTAIVAGLLGVVCLALAAFALLFVPGYERLIELVTVEWRHSAIATYSRLTAPHLDTADDVRVSPMVSNPVGVNTFLEQEPDPAARRRTMQMIHAAGIGWVRQEFPWKDIEQQGPGNYTDRKFGTDTWAKYDDIVNLAAEYQVRLIVRLSTTPAWAHPNVPGDDLVPPDNYDDFGNFAAAVARRYKGKVAVYQVWNEPNLDREWGNRPVDPAGYVRLLQVASRRIRQADPDALVMSAALAPTIEQSEHALSDLVFLQRMYEAGVGGSFDILGAQDYGLRNGPDDMRLDFGDVNASRVLRLREVMVRHGDAAKPIWATEVGWNAAPTDLPYPNDYGRVSERLQAQYTVRLFERARREWPWMGVMTIWFFKRADASEAEQPWYYFRMVDPDFTPRPLYDAIAAYTRERGLILPSTIERALR